MAQTSSKVTVRVFARYVDLLGMTELSVPVDGSITVASVIAHVRRLPGGEDLPERVLVAVNHSQADLAQVVGPGDEVALLPPMSGG